MISNYTDGWIISAKFGRVAIWTATGSVVSMRLASFGMPANFMGSSRQTMLIGTPCSTSLYYTTLGYDESSWNGNEWRCDEHWWDLSADQRGAVETLGWTEQAWEYQYEETAWKDLPANVKKACRKLGYDASTWDETEEDDDKYPSIMEMEWSDFTKEEQKCMNVLGYTQQMWED